MVYEDLQPAPSGCAKLFLKGISPSLRALGFTLRHPLEGAGNFATFWFQALIPQMA